MFSEIHFFKNNVVQQPQASQKRTPARSLLQFALKVDEGNGMCSPAIPVDHRHESYLLSELNIKRNCWVSLCFISAPAVCLGIETQRERAYSELEGAQRIESDS